MLARELFLELLLVAIGKRTSLTEDLQEEQWTEVFELALKHSVAGVCFSGVTLLPDSQRPPQNLFWEWLGMSLSIQSANERADKYSAKIWKLLHDEGLKGAVIKGQGIACEYGNLAPLRQSGDVDVWIKGGFKATCDFVQKHCPTTEVAYHRFNFNAFKEMDVEIHHRPTFFRNLIVDCRFSKWLAIFQDNDFIYKEDKGFAVPSSEINRILILAHLYRHFLFEGVGLRHVMDYYYVLRNSTRNEQELRLLHILHLNRFAEAMMWILHELFELEEDRMICKMNAKEGRFLLDEIMQGGNFGHGDSRYRYKHLFYVRRLFSRSRHFILHYPSEIVWTPFFLLFHKFWKRRKIKYIRENYSG